MSARNNALVAALLCAACAHTAPPPPARHGWAVLVYMAADQADLEPHALADLAELATGSGDVRVLVDLDLYSRPGHFRFDPARGLPAAPTGPEPSAPPADRLRDFIADATRESGAAHHLLVLWGHGQGWRARSSTTARLGPGAFPGGLAFDTSDSSVLDIPSLADALRGQPLDIVAGDACLLETLEIADELRGTARYLVGSEQIEAYEGLPYDRVLEVMRAPPPHPRCAADEACRIAAALPALAVASGPPTAISAALDLTQVDAVAAALARVIAAARAALDRDPLLAIDHAVALGALPRFLGGSRDVGLLLARLRQLAPNTDDALLAVLGDADHSVARAVIEARFGARYDGWSGRAGVSLWLPLDREQWVTRKSDYLDSKFHQRIDTARWLDRVYAEP